MIVQCLWVSFLENLHGTSFILLGIPRDLKGLLHMLNVIVSLMKAELCFLFLLCFYFCFVKELAKYKFGGI
jgi:hypothetical protein